MFSRLVKQLSEKEGVTEALKAENQMLWVQRMNNIRSTAMEIVAMGLDEICFTDHVDYGIKKDWDEPGKMIYRKGSPGEPDEMPLANVHYPIYYETFKEMWALYHDKIELKLGLEFGMQAHTIEKYEKLFMSKIITWWLYQTHLRSWRTS